MLRLLLIPCMMAVAQLDSEPDGWSLSANNILSELKCSKIHGNLPGCYECYTCDHEKIKEKRGQGTSIRNLELTDGKCQSRNICCVSQKDYNYRDSTSCGLSKPIVKRPHLRAVMHGEYPWRAWVYSKGDRLHPLCAATFINDNARTLLVSARCVQHNEPDSLVVRFSKDSSYKDLNIKRKIVHEHFDADTYKNDIALLSLESFDYIPGWVRVACLPEIPLPYGSPCIGVSDDDNSINFVLPEQSLCNETGLQLPKSQMCTITPRRDYEHEFGGGLWCLKNEGQTTKSYTLYGIALYRSGDVLNVYTNVLDFKDWITKQISYLL